jgi:CubicO group peptidase (beta-lactamase class C family)
MSSAPTIASIAPPARKPCPRDSLTASKRRRFDATAKDDFLPRADPRDVGVDGARLDALIDGAEQATSDALLVIKDGRVLVEREVKPEAGPIELRSIAKGIAALAILALVADGAISSIDEPLSTFFPEFSQGEKRSITLREVMSHTTGLKHAATNANALNAQADRTAYARSLPLVDPPGTVFSYSNEATQLLSAVIQQKAGMPADEYVKQRIFAPLGITDFTWKKDRAGNPQTYYGVSLTARGLARIGMLLLGEGSYEGKRVLPAALVAKLFEPSARYGGYGLCFWLDPKVAQRADRLSALGLSKADHSALAALTDKPFDSSEAYFVEAKKLVNEASYARLRTVHRERKGSLETLPGQASALIALGGLGQRLEVHPAERLIAVRLHRRRPGDNAIEAQVTFRAMQEHVHRLAPPCD